MRRFYTLAWWLALPLAFFYLLWRSRRQPEYRQHWLERLGFIAPAGDRPVIWVHAVSVGETRAAEPLIRALQARHPDHAILLTHMTPTGRATGRALFGDGVTQAYLPYDLPPLARRFLDRARPRLGLIMETEVWPNLFAACRQRGVPLFLVNARLSEKSAQGYARLRPLIQPALAGLAGLAAQTPADAERLRRLANLPTPALPINGEGAHPSPIYVASRERLKPSPASAPSPIHGGGREGLKPDSASDLSPIHGGGWEGLKPKPALDPSPIHGGGREGLKPNPAIDPSPIYGGGWEGEPPILVAGNLKFDVAPPAETAARAAELRRLFGARFVMLAASTREGEEALLLDALLPLDLPELLLLIVPRHPQRFAEVARMIGARGLNCPRRSQGQAVANTDRIYLGDSMGEMAAYCAASDLVIMGGSLLPFGGQNLIEAAAAGKPVLIGPHTWNFEQASRDAIAAGAARRVQDAKELAEAVRGLYEDGLLREEMGAASIDFAQSHRGATERILQLVEPHLKG
ncbi:3-deoxy-D-manno-octulosonic-acid transferase [Sulfuritortus calidifontis]|uniref:3-deoxy-D-manno-octulosonic acid transferase n=1 Tax=Sulfuritortus calidifontis TaxID=1914471 RepID=A0A4R3JWW9_9PROT|nr:3-deoxy-D-manno-octulosonic acid transferase [Sulfuritortus calidifontis]TCS70998.1 3-deoxy-D-manno-octulosonic-acid transferase [Sulfuritortus calidifontis]